MVVVSFAPLARAEGGLPLRLPVFGESALSITSTSIVEYRGDNFDMSPYDDEFLALTQRLETSLSGEELSLSVRLDGFVPFFEEECPVEDESLCFLETDVRPERVTLRWQRGDFTAEAGDSYVVLGRGIALSFRKVDILGIDTTIRGGHAVLDTRRFVARIVGGVSNPQNLDPRTLRIFDEPLDVVVAAELGTRIGADDQLELGAHVLRIWFEEDRATEQQATLDIVGWRAAATGLLDGHLSLYAEVDALRRRVESGFSADRRELGRAVYGSAQLSVDRLSILLEWKDYRDFVVARSDGEGFAHRTYGAPPTIERDGQEIRAQGNARGGGIGLEQGLGDSPWSVSAHALLYGLGEEREDPWDGILVAHGYAGVRRRSEGASGIDWTLDVVGGYRRETYLHDPPGDAVGLGDVDWETVHGEIDGGIASNDHSVELRLEHRIERRRTFDYVDYVRGGATLTYAFRGVLSVSPIVRWDTQREEGVPEIYPAGEARLTFGSGSFVRVFGGRTPGGRLCAGGICRDVPPFEGVLGELVLRL